MNITTAIEEKICTITLEGSIHALNSQELTQAVDAAAPDCEKMILDMTLVDYISSSGLRAVLGAYLLVGGENLTLRGLSPFVKEIFWATGLDEFLNIE